MATNNAPTRLAVFAVGAISLVVLSVGTLSGSLENGTDAMYATVARDVANGNLWTPEIAGGPYLLKPPLYFWACGLALKLVGSLSEPFALRLPGLLSGWVAVMLTAAIAGRLARDARAYVAAAIIALLSPTFFEYARRVFMEETLAAAMLAVLYCALRAGDEDRPTWLWGVGLCSAAAVLTKSYGGGFAGLAVVIWLVATGRSRWLWSGPFVGGVAAGAALIAGYVAVLLHLAPEAFIAQNLAPFKLGSAEQFLWYRTESFFYLKSPLDPARLAPESTGLAAGAAVLGSAVGFLGGAGALIHESLRARRNRERRGSWLLLAYVASGLIVWGSLSQQRLYYLVPFFPALAAAAAVGLTRLLPSGVATTATLAALGGLFPLAQIGAFGSSVLDPEPALSTLGRQYADQLPENTRVVYRYNDFFAATEWYLGRRAVTLTPSQDLLREFRRILVVGERDTARDGSPGAVFDLYGEHVARGEPFVMVADEESLIRLMAGLPGLQLWSRVPDRAYGALWLVASTPPLDPSRTWPGPAPVPHPVAYSVAADWLLDRGRIGEARALLTEGSRVHPDHAPADLERLGRVPAPEEPGVAPVPVPGGPSDESTGAR